MQVSAEVGTASDPEGITVDTISAVTAAWIGDLAVERLLDRGMGNQLVGLFKFELNPSEAMSQLRDIRIFDALDAAATPVKRKRR